MSLSRFANLSVQLRWALARDPASVGPLLEEMTTCLQEVQASPLPPRAVILKTWRQNRALLQLLEGALSDLNPLKVRA